MENGGASNFALCPRVILFSFFFNPKKKNLKIIESTVRFEFIRVSNSNNYLLIQENNRDEQFSKKKKIHACPSLLRNNRGKKIKEQSRIQKLLRTRGTGGGWLVAPFLPWMERNNARETYGNGMRA